MKMEQLLRAGDRFLKQINQKKNTANVAKQKIDKVFPRE